LDTVAIRIEAADPQERDALALLREAAVEARTLYPELFTAERPWPTNPSTGLGGTYVLAYIAGAAVGCGALRRIDDQTAELRRMYVLRTVRRSGVARALLSHLERVAVQFGYARMRLETGHRQTAASALYESSGFVRIPAFGPYVGDATSVCYEKEIGGCAQV
jgi:GNAT superfamily N-acetyltransferase